MGIKKLLVMVGVFFSLASFGYGATNELLGAGATFPYPLYSKMFDIYSSSKGIKVNYQSIGSGGGIRQLKNKTVDFGGSDAFLSDAELKDMPGKVLHVPTCLGGVALTYELPGKPELKFTPVIIEGIFLGKINKWNDPLIQKVNPGIKLPNIAIAVVHRSDGSGTTAIFTDYLGKVSSAWKTKVGVGKSVNWPIGLGGKGNAGVAGLIRQVPGSIGYVEYSYAFQNKLPIGKVQNSSGSFIAPSIESVSVAADTKMPDDTRISITNTAAKNGYPIAGFTWILVYAEQNYEGRSAAKAQETSKLLWWMIHEGQQYTKPLDYSPLSKSALLKAENVLKTMTYNGKKLL